MNKPRTYAVVYGQTATGYAADVPDLPGCIAAGPTLEKTARLIRTAIAMHLAGMEEDGDPLPEPTTTVEAVTVTPAMVEVFTPSVK